MVRSSTRCRRRRWPRGCAPGGAIRFVAALGLAPACLPPPPVYKVQRTARVPHPAAPLRSGAPLAGPVELSVGTSSVLETRAPRLADPQASVEVPSVQLRGELRFRLGTYGELDLIHDHAIESTMHALDHSQAAVQDDPVFSVGMGLRYAVHSRDLPHLFLGLGVEVLGWNTPYVEYRSCVANCDGVPLQETSRGEDMLGAFAWSITPTYRDGALTVFGGIYAAPHPTIVRKGTEYSAVDYDSELESGAYNYVVHAGLEYALGPVSVLAQVQDDLTRAPVWYGPSFGFAVALHAPESIFRPDPPDHRPSRPPIHRVRDWPEPDDRDY